MADKRERTDDSGNVYPKKKCKSGSQKRREHDNKLLLESAKNENARLFADIQDNHTTVLVSPDLRFGYAASLQNGNS